MKAVDLGRVFDHLRAQILAFEFVSLLAFGHEGLLIVLSQYNTPEIGKPAAADFPRA
jgi:hypothetical protein